MITSVMLECKLCQGTKEAFVRDVKAAPEPQCILCFDSQIADMERFLSSSSDVHGILTVDPTYNLGEFYVTPTTYPHLYTEHCHSFCSPLFGNWTFAFDYGAK